MADNCRNREDLGSSEDDKERAKKADEDILKKYKPIFITIINKICQRKAMLVDIINQAIEYSLYKYVIHTSYMDARSRTYSAAVTMNIFTNPYAKLFIKLYDENEG